MMKKILAIMLGAALVLSMAGAVAAADKEIKDGTETPVIVTYTITDNYIVIIPDSASVTVIKDDNNVGTVSVSRIILEGDKTLTVSVKSDNTWILKDPTIDSTSQIGYTLSYTPSKNAGSLTSVTTKTEIPRTATDYTPIFMAKMTNKYASTKLTLNTFDDTTSITTTVAHTDTLKFKVTVA